MCSETIPKALIIVPNPIKSNLSQLIINSQQKKIKMMKISQPNFYRKCCYRNKRDKKPWKQNGNTISVPQSICVTISPDFKHLSHQVKKMW